MSGYTHNLKLHVPYFDQDPWDVDVNTNWTILDATVGMFAAIPNLVGIWQNATAYAYSQSVIDPVDSTIWSCVQAHTSSAAPVTFVQERTSYPARWTSTTQGAQFWATQAANSASAAAASAAAAAASAASAAGKLPLAGGTMTGFIVLHADPSAAMNPATKQYVDARVGGTGYLPITGGTLTGPLSVGGNGVSYPLWGPSTHAIGFGWNASSQLVFSVDGAGMQALATQPYVSGGFLPLSGGNLSGNLYAAGTISAQNTIGINGSGAFFGSDTNYTDINWDSSNWRLRYFRTSGMLQYINNVGALIFQFDNIGNGVCHGLQTASTIVSYGGLFARDGNVYWGATDRCHLATDGTNITFMAMLDNYRWSLEWATGRLSWFRYDNLAMCTIENTGNLNAYGTVTANGGPCYGNGAYVNISDERVKLDIQPSVYGLAEIVRLDPISFVRIEGTHVEHGFSAQQVQGVLPHAVVSARDNTDILGVVLDPIVGALVNGMKELTGRVSALEGR